MVIIVVILLVIDAEVKAVVVKVTTMVLLLISFKSLNMFSLLPFICLIVVIVVMVVFWCCFCNDYSGDIGVHKSLGGISRGGLKAVVIMVVVVVDIFWTNILTICHIIRKCYITTHV